MLFFILSLFHVIAEHHTSFIINRYSLKCTWRMWSVPEVYLTWHKTSVTPIPLHFCFTFIFVSVLATLVLIESVIDRSRKLQLFLAKWIQINTSQCALGKPSTAKRKTYFTTGIITNRKSFPIPLHWSCRRAIQEEHSESWGGEGVL